MVGALFLGPVSPCRPFPGSGSSSNSQLPPESCYGTSLRTPTSLFLSLFLFVLAICLESVGKESTEEWEIQDYALLIT